MKIYVVEETDFTDSYYGNSKLHNAFLDKKTAENYLEQHIEKLILKKYSINSLSELPKRKRSNNAWKKDVEKEIRSMKYDYVITEIELI